MTHNVRIVIGHLKIAIARLVTDFFNTVTLKFLSYFNFILKEYTCCLRAEHTTVQVNLKFQCHYYWFSKTNNKTDPSSFSLRQNSFMESQNVYDKVIKIPHYCEIRFLSKYKGVNFFKTRLSALKKYTLSKKAKGAAEAQCLLNQLANFETLLMFFAYMIFYYTLIYHRFIYK